MDHFEQLVDEVVERVMDAIQQQKDSLPNPVETESPKKTYTLIGKEYQTIETYFNHHQYSKNNSQDETSDVLVITEINPYSIPRMANIMPMTEQEEVVLNYVLNNKTVYLLSEAIQGVTTKVEGQFKRRYSQHVNELKKLGVQFVNTSYFSSDNHEVKSLGAHGTKKKLITLDYLQSFSLNNYDTFEIEKNVIVTPLAMDYLKDLNIIIKRRGI